MRPYIVLLLALLCSRAEAQPAEAEYEKLRALMPAGAAPFHFGVASGDPLPDRVMLWTRITPDDTSRVRVRWEVAEDSLFHSIRSQGMAEVALRRGSATVLVDAGDLAPATTYFYRFTHEGRHSRTGRTRTAPSAPCDALSFAVVSCQNYEAGYFSAYSDIARRNDLQAVLHLGDYIYEYKAGRYGDAAIPRAHLPAHELVHEEDYMMRYALYRLDPQLQDAHARHPFIAVWDDHEFANDSYTGGAQNHQPEEGDWAHRKAAARKAYFEWMPVRPQPGGRLYRSFSFGSLAQLWMPDERMAGRTRQASGPHDPDFTSPDRRILGQEQFDWLTAEMAASTASWRILGNQVILSSVDASSVFPKNPKFLDMWDGYPAERSALLDFMHAQSMRNVVVVTGDSHTSWAMDLLKDPHVPGALKKKQCASCVGAEFTAPSISSANYDEYVARWKAREAQRRFTRWGRNPHVRFNDVTHHGYLLLHLTPAAASGEWIFIRSTRDQQPHVRVAARYILERSSSRIKSAR
jgi:alkaline phosphatase D